MYSDRTQMLLEKSRQGMGLLPEEVDILLKHDNETVWDEIFHLAKNLTERHFRKTLQFFVPLYFSSFCQNDCAYCGFRVSNRSLKRTALAENEFLQEARFLWLQGHRRLLLIAGEHPIHAGMEQLTLYLSVLQNEGLDFSIMLEMAPFSVEDYRILHQQGVNQCLLFQETYNRHIYAHVHRGKKNDYDWRLHAMNRALEAGIEHVGLGILLGLGSWREDLVELIRHAYEIKEQFGFFPATFSFPRLRPAQGVASFYYSEVFDEDFQKILAISRLACPEVGIVLSSREEPQFRRKLLQTGIGVTHLSAGSSTIPGGYTLNKESINRGQFEIADYRSLEEVEQDTQKLGYHRGGCYA